MGSALVSEVKEVYFLPKCGNALASEVKEVLLPAKSEGCICLRSEGSALACEVRGMYLLAK